MSIVTTGDYNAALLEIMTAAGNTDEETTSAVLIMAGTMLTRIWTELQERKDICTSMSNTLVDISLAIDKHKKAVKTAQMK